MNGYNGNKGIDEAVKGYKKEILKRRYERAVKKLGEDLTEDFVSGLEQLVKNQEFKKLLGDLGESYIGKKGYGKKDYDDPKGPDDDYFKGPGWPPGWPPPPLPGAAVAIEIEIEYEPAKPKAKLFPKVPEYIPVPDGGIGVIYITPLEEAFDHKEKPADLYKELQRTLKFRQY